jgi:hypothetical protein
MTTFKLSFNKQAWDSPTLFIITEFVKTRMDNIINMDLGLKNLKKLFVTA